MRREVKRPAQSLIASCAIVGKVVSILAMKKENSFHDLFQHANSEPILECLKNHVDGFRRDLPLELPMVCHFRSYKTMAWHWVSNSAQDAAVALGVQRYPSVCICLEL